MMMLAVQDVRRTQLDYDDVWAGFTKARLPA
jgi:hypothetical protein